MQLIKAVFFDFWKTLFQPTVEINEYYRIRVEKLHEVLCEVDSSLSLKEVDEAYWRIRGLCDEVRSLGVEVPLQFEVKLLLHNLRLHFFNDDLIFKLIEAYMHPFVHFTKPMNDVRMVLERIRRLGLRVALISNVLSGRHITAVLEKWDLISFFDALIYSDEVGFRKPRLEIFDYAFSLLNVRADESVMVGDDVEADIKGALNCGMRAIHVHGGCSNYELAVKSLLEALKIIEKWAAP